MPEASRSPLLVIGLGPVGLVTAAGFADLGFPVVGVDIDEDKVRTIREGRSPYHEPGLEPLIAKNIASGNLQVDTRAESWIPRAEVIFICVGTPPRPDTGEADTSAVEAVVDLVIRHHRGYTLLVEKSTVPVETARHIEERLQRANHDHIELASNPEFLREGAAVHDFFHPDRIVIGVRSPRAERILRGLYQKINAPIVVADIETAEIIKYAANTFLATKISFINMVADLCEKTGADVDRVAEGIGLDKRISPYFLRAGIGFGGSCFPKDLKAFLHTGRRYGLDFGLVEAVIRINENRIAVFLDHLRQVLGGDLRDREIALLGLSFKPDTDDIREAPSLKLIPRLLEAGARLRLHDPVAMPHVQKLFPPGPALRYAGSVEEAVAGADAIALVTEWQEYRNMDLDRIKTLLRHPILVDGRNVFDPEEMKRRGFIYYPMGKGRWIPQGF